MYIQFKKLDKIKLLDGSYLELDKEKIVLPKYAHEGDVGLDITCVHVEYDPEYDQYIYHTGLACASDFQVAILGFTRSSNCKTDAYLTNGVGVIDSSIYRGEIQLRYKNRQSIISRAFESCVVTQLGGMAGQQPFAINYLRMQKEFIENALNFAPYNVGDRVGQLIPMNIEKAVIEEVDELNETTRGDGGFGSTGK